MILPGSTPQSEQGSSYVQGLPSTVDCGGEVVSMMSRKMQRYDEFWRNSGPSWVETMIGSAGLCHLGQEGPQDLLQALKQEVRVLPLGALLSMGDDT